MNKRFLHFAAPCAALLLLAASCTRTGNSLVAPPPESGTAGKTATAGTAVFAAGDTLLNATYENGTTNSGITGLTGTDAPAPDAAYMVSPGASGTYAVAHKVVFGDSAYISDGAYRSETTARLVSAANFTPGQERRYEFSVLLKDWPDWNGASPVDGGNLFQCRVSGDAYVPVMIRVRRNGIIIREADTQVFAVVSDYRPYVNQWIRFRIDVLWTTDSTGYIKVYTQLPGETGYTLRRESTGLRTYTGTGTSGGGAFGYPKWGLYGGPDSGTRIVYHDDVRIIALN
ncbi:heparin lyase I family protein [Niabella beijingensis]|uniref:heparin lyase I family protein n=1 Tax=Niabella beijingensis TaxID=2872700 RepID=UPI001CBF57AF|nr:heparin lyase I family protein [Niabella beijingensis]MBZ4191436.1 polysaccharide lyase [Niabella beijingensis]